MIHILSQDGARMVNAEQIIGYEIKERMVHRKSLFGINGHLPSMS